jgi:hypothetical protein
VKLRQNTDELFINGGKSSDMREKMCPTKQIVYHVRCVNIEVLQLLKVRKEELFISAVDFLRFSSIN